MSLCFHDFIRKLLPVLSSSGVVTLRFVSGWIWLYLNFSHSEMGEMTVIFLVAWRKKKIQKENFHEVPVKEKSFKVFIASTIFNSISVCLVSPLSMTFCHQVL